eukprot:360264-Chlamydomonas_euryale.AAC.7
MRALSALISTGGMERSWSFIRLHAQLKRNFLTAHDVTFLVCIFGEMKLLRQASKQAAHVHANAIDTIPWMWQQMCEPACDDEYIFQIEQQKLVKPPRVSMRPALPWVGCRRAWAGSRTGRAFGDGSLDAGLGPPAGGPRPSRDPSRMNSCARPVGDRRRAW